MRRLVSYASVLGATLMAPSSVGAQDAGQRCVLHLDYADRGYGQGTDNYFAAGNVQLSCRGSSVRMRSDSLASYASQIIEFIGHVRYEDSSMVMTADRGTYYRDGERWEARGNVVTKSTRGSTMRGPALDYFRTIPGQRELAEVFATGRPTIQYVPKDSTGKAQEPYVIVGDRVRMKGEDLLWAGGRVTIDRSDLAASADSMRLDTGAGQDGALIRDAVVRGLGKDSFSLAGNRIDLKLANSELTYVQADGAGKATSAEWTLVADTIGLDINDRKLEQTVAWGKASRPHAVSTDYEILADSLALDTPDQQLTEARSFGNAWLASGQDSVASQRDWLRGDTVIARFARSDSSGKGRTSVSRIDSRQAARSFYKVKDAAHPGRPSLNYARGDRIVVTMRADSTGGVERVEIQGKVDGVQLEPAKPAAHDSAGRAGHDSLPAPVRDTTAAATAPPAPKP
jgi:hypothetical protein